jgi:flavorubredoxin
VETTIDEISDGIYRLSTYVPDQDFTFNQFLVDADEPLLFHCGLRSLFPPVSEAAARVVPLDRLRWITFGHYEADECGSMNAWLAGAPRAQVAHGPVGVMVSVTDAADRPPRQLADGEVLDLGGKRVRWIDTPHVPHGWDAGLLYEETTRTLFCGDLFTTVGASPALTSVDLVEPAMAAEDAMSATALTPATAPTIRALAALSPRTLAVMHGASFSGDGAGQLEALAAEYEDRLLKLSLSLLETKTR